MSVSNECKYGDNIYIIENFVEPVIDINGLMSIDKSYEYRVGDKVTFLDWYYKSVEGNGYTFIKFKDTNGRTCTAVETYFATEYVWNGLKRYFKLYFNNTLPDSKHS
ncbi:hypothetical protein JOC70_000086 [Clostridium pascui]|uniref:hypothetical protein n=1 Tax=Clostridium pascui TaxID=46609 RepID=UPI00195B9C16|nr:hypothetical protein [Clostridium pascui]MBM7868617.1 hypothetical protein [Clostridium pascui]